MEHIAVSSGQGGLRSWVRRYPVLTLCALTLGFQLSIVLIAAHLMPEGVRLHDVPQAHSVFRLRVFWPLLFAVGITYYIEGMAGLRELFGSYRIWRVPGRFYAFGLTWKFLFCYLAWALADVLGIVPWPGAYVENFFGGTYEASMGLLRTMPFILGIALVEETTWMKFCVTRLQAKYSALVSCLITGIAWGWWYLPMLLLHEGVPDGVPWYMFLLSMAGLAVILGWVYNMTHSGLVLLVMQVISNIAFFVMPALPTWHGMDSIYVKCFIWVEVAIAALLVLRYGWRDMGPGPRPVWGDATGLGKEGSAGVKSEESTLMEYDQRAYTGH